MTDTNGQERVRPRFLFFLCILTFSSSISGLWTRSEQLWSPALAVEMYHQAFDRVQELIAGRYPEDQADSLNAVVSQIKPGITPDVVRTSSLIFLVYESLTLYGAFFMWNLKRKGFFIYLGGIAVVFFGHLFLLGGVAGFVFSLGSALWSGVFSLLYYTHLKYMD